MSPRRLWPLLLSALALVAVPFALSPRAEAQTEPLTYYVTTTDDDRAGDCRATPLDCTLRQAILAANLDGVASVIRFELGFPAGGLQTITPVDTELPPLNANGDRIEGAVDNFGRPRVVIDGAGVRRYGIQITGKNNVVSRLIFTNFRSNLAPNGVGVWITTANATGNRVYGNYFGVFPDDPTARPNRRGVQIDNGASGNFVGERVDQPTERNIIAGNEFSGLYIEGANSNYVYGNYIGLALNATGAVVPLGNSGPGIEISNSSSNEVGSTDALPRRNVVSANSGAGIRLSGSVGGGNVIRGNYIGTNDAGTAALPGQEVGVLIEAGARNNQLIGINTAPLVISGHTGYGVRIRGLNTGGNVIAGAYIGTDYLGATAIANGTGVRIENGASNNLIGPNTLVSGNTGDGIALDRTTAPNASPVVGNEIRRSVIGLNATGTLPLPNGGRGVAVLDGAQGTIVGGVTTTTSFEGNIIAANGQEGVLVEGQANRRTLVRNNFVGLRRVARDGLITVATPNGGTAGILVTSGAREVTISTNTVGGTATASTGFPAILVQGDGTGSASEPSATNVADVTLDANRIGCLPNTMTMSPCGSDPIARPNREGIVVTGGVRNVSMLNNTVQLNIGAGIRLSDVYSVTLRSNANAPIAANSGDGILIGGNSFDVRVLSTTLRSNAGQAIRLTDNVQRVSLRYNRLTRNGGPIELVGTTINFPPGSNPGDLNRPNRDIDPPIVDPAFASPARLRIFQSGRIEGYVLTSTAALDQPPNPPSACVNCSIQVFEPDPTLTTPDAQGFNLLRTAADAGVAGQDALPAAANGFFTGFLQLSGGRLPRQLLLIATDGAGNSSQYARFDISTGLTLEATSPLTASRGPGETVTYTLRLRNTGSVDFDNLILSTSGTLAGWQLTTDPDANSVIIPSLPAQRTRDITVTLTLPLGDHPNVRVPKTDRTTLTIRSAGVATATATLETTVLGRPIITVTPPSSQGAGRPTERVPYSYVLRNNGNVTVTLGLNYFTRDPAISPGIWATTISTDSVTLRPGSEARLLAEVTVPPGAQQSVGGQLVEATTFFTATVPASTQFGYPQQTVPFSATTRVNVSPSAIIYPDQEQSAFANSEVRFFHTVENKSNGPARFCFDYVANKQSSVRFESGTTGFVIDNQGCFDMDTETNFQTGRFQTAQFVVVVRTERRLLPGEIETINVFLRRDTPTGPSLAEARLVDRVVITGGEQLPRLWLPLIRN